MIPVSKFTSGRAGERVRLVVLHTSEGARTVESLAAFLNRDGVNASYHGAVDDARYEAYVDFSNTAWHLRNGNQEADGLCLCAMAGWSGAEWLRHPRMLGLAGAWVAQRCAARGVPIRWLSPAETAAALRDDHHPGGVIDHDTYTKATGDGTHWDVGGNFPRDHVLGLAQNLIGGVDLTKEESRMLGVVYDELTRRHPSRSVYAGDPKPTDTIGGAALNADGRAHEALVEQREAMTRLSARLDQVQADLAAIRKAIPPG